MTRPDPALRQWATARQAEYLDAVIEHGSNRAAGKVLGVAHQAIDRSMVALKRKAALAGYSPDHDMTHTVPAPFVARGVSTYYDREGKVTGQWVKSSLDREAVHAMMEATAESMAQEIPRLDPIEGPAHPNERLCNLFTMTDVHIGMLAWHKEGGADWDIKIAERVLVGCFEQMIMAAPRAKVGIVNIQGDAMHYDGLTAITPMSGHVLDAEGRFSKMVGATIRIIRRMVDVALMNHAEVHVIIAEGNHDMASSVWLRLMFAALYENDPRLTVNNSELPYYVYQHGKTMLAFHHGHLKKNDQLPLLFAAQYPIIWGATTKRYCHTGHRHHVEEREHGGMIVIQHPTLAARDAYASRHGWISERQATAITFHDEFGQVARNTVTPEMLEAA